MSLQVGQEILNGEFQILELISQGTLGAVWRALERCTDTQVAIKEALTGNQRAQQRFRREVAISRRLDHPHLLRADAVRPEGPSLYLILPYAPGGSLRQQFVEKGPLPVLEVAQIALGVAQGLGYMHRRNLVHRDVHPGNILFAQDGVVKLSDFGLAQSPEWSDQLWQGSQRYCHPGNPHYQPPEACARPGSPLSPLNPAADVYMLAATLWEMLTGKLYKEGGPRLQALRPEAPLWLERLLGRCLSIDPRRRPVDGSELARLLEAELKHEEKVGPRKTTIPLFVPPAPGCEQLYEEAKKYLERRRWERAIQLLERIVQGDPGYRDAAVLLAKAKEQANEEARRKLADLIGNELADRAPSCPRCGRPIPEGPFCPSCGQAIVICLECGRPMKAEDDFCQHCGGSRFPF